MKHRANQTGPSHSSPTSPLNPSQDIREWSFPPTISVTQEIEPAKGSLSDREQADLLLYEGIIHRGLQSFVELGHALSAIRNKHLYRAKYETFEAYCKDRWMYHRSYAYSLINASMVAGHLSAIADIPKPTHESQVRPLAKLPPHEIGLAWMKAITIAGGKPISAKHVKLAVLEVTGNGGTNASAKMKKPPNLAGPLQLDYVLDLARQAEKSIDDQMGTYTTLNLVRRLRKYVEMLRDYKPYTSSYSPADNSH